MGNNRISRATQVVGSGLNTWLEGPQTNARAQTKVRGSVFWVDGNHDVKCKAEVGPEPLLHTFLGGRSGGVSRESQDEGQRPTIPLTGGQESAHNHTPGFETSFCITAGPDSWVVFIHESWLPPQIWKKSFREHCAFPTDE